MQPKPIIRAVLFDLDGTLIDSAPDLAGAGNDMRIARGLDPHPLDHFRPMVGSGARGMIGRAFDIGPDHETFLALRDEFLQRYESRMTQDSHVFPRVVPMLAALNAGKVAWGIVTNKATRFSDPIVRALGLLPPAATLVCGDTTPHSKPHPEPLLEAARRMGVAPIDCIYVGDDLRDVQAGRAAGMQTAAVRWGYLGAGEPVEAWGADYLLEEPTDLLKLLEMA
jgi:2-phosphoglycolate phosphatase